MLFSFLPAAALCEEKCEDFGTNVGRVNPSHDFVSADVSLENPGANVPDIL